jgi:hypothetical protein
MAYAAPSIFSLSAAVLYMIVLFACAAAAMIAGRHGQPPRHWRIWAAIAFGFMLLALLRITGFEEAIRDLFRDMLRAEGAYDDRRSLQRPLAAGLLCVVSLLVGWGLARQWRLARGRRNLAVAAALTGFATMIMLLGVRIVSLHQLDRLLYGPPKLNWIIDLGASMAVLGAALLYVRYVVQRP